MGISRRSILIAIAALFAFAVVLTIGHYATYGSLPDARLARFYALLVGLLGGIPVLLQLYRLGLLFIGTASIGWIVDCLVTAARDPLRPTMEAGMYNLFIIIVGAVAAITVEVLHQVRRRSRNNG